MILDDFVFLGTTVPEQMSDGRVVRCSAGYSHERRSLVRVYPLSPFASIKRWDRYRLDLESNAKDCRLESYKLRGDRADVEALTRDLVENCRLGQVARTARLAEVDRYLVPSIAWLNGQRRSLGIIAPDLEGYRFEVDPIADDAVMQLPGFEVTAPEWGRHSFPRRPRIVFSDADGRHDLSLNEHGVYEWLRKEPAAASKVFENLRFGDSEREVRLLVGNLANHRTAWVVIAYLSFAKVAPSLFDNLTNGAVA